MSVRSCGEYLATAQDELDAANATEIDLSDGLRAALPAALVVGQHLANSYISALMALTVGTRTQQ